MTEPNPYILDDAGQAMVDKHIALTPVIKSDSECQHYAQELVRMSDGQTCETPVEARAMVIAVLARMLEYDRLVDAFDLVARSASSHQPN